MSQLKVLNIDQRLAQVGVGSSRAGMNITHNRRTMRLREETPQVQIETSTPKFSVNRRKINAEMNLYGPVELTKKHRDKGKQTVLSGIRRAGQEGDFLGDARRPGQQIGQLARNNAMAAAMRKKDFNIGLMPQSMPEMTWDTGSVNINWTRHSLVIDWDGDYMPQLTVDIKFPVDIHLRAEPYFSVTVEDLKTPGKTTGLSFDQWI